jgi:hypothetical protein
MCVVVGRLREWVVTSFGGGEANEVAVLPGEVWMDVVF